MTPSSDPMDLSRLDHSDDNEADPWDVHNEAEEPLQSRALTVGSSYDVIPAPAASQSKRKSWEKKGLCKRCGGQHDIQDCSYAPTKTTPKSCLKNNNSTAGGYYDQQTWDNTQHNYRIGWLKDDS